MIYIALIALGFCWSSTACIHVSAADAAAPQHEAFRSGNIDTGFIARYAEDLQVPPPPSKTRAFLSDLAKSRKKGSKALA
jgi:hypothetical protein